MEQIIKKMTENNEYKIKFNKLNPKRKDFKCCNGNCITNNISKNDTLICAKCEKEKHIDYFLESNTFYFCDVCDK